MKKLWAYSGRLIFWPAWPALYIYFKIHNQRTRVIVTKADQILVLKSWLGDGAWSLPGGGLHRHEKPIIGALRELKEETGIQADAAQLKFFGVIVAKRPGLTLKLHCYSMEVGDNTITKPQTGEIVDIAWLPAKDLLTKHFNSSDTHQIILAWQKTKLAPNYIQNSCETSDPSHTSDDLI